MPNKLSLLPISATAMLWFFWLQNHWWWIPWRCRLQHCHYQQSYQSKTYGAQTKKIVPSNVSLVIPNYLHLTRSPTKQPQAQISFAKISFTCPSPNNKYGHVISITQIKDFPFPPSFTIQHNGSLHQIFLSSDDLICFKCHSCSRTADVPITHWVK